MLIQYSKFISIFLIFLSKFRIVFNAQKKVSNKIYRQIIIYFLSDHYHHDACPMGY
jgi:hypothetical protein